MEIYSLKDPIPGGNLTNKHKRDTIKNNASGDAISFQVTNIKQGIKNPNRANIFINDKFSFSLDISQIVDFKLKIGQILTLDQLQAYKSASEYGKLYQRTLEWVLVRPRSVRETRDYLIRKFRTSFEGHPQSLRGRSDEPREDGREERPEEDGPAESIYSYSN